MLPGLASMAEKNMFIGTKTGMLHMVPLDREDDIVWPERHTQSSVREGHERTLDLAYRSC